MANMVAYTSTAGTTAANRSAWGDPQYNGTVSPPSRYTDEERALLEMRMALLEARNTKIEEAIAKLQELLLARGINILELT
jgi:hypothetical protein